MTPLASARNQKATNVRVTTTSFDERMSNIEFHSNDVNETRAFSEGVPSGRCPVDQQHRAKTWYDKLGVPEFIGSV